MSHIECETEVSILGINLPIGSDPWTTSLLKYSYLFFEGVTEKHGFVFTIVNVRKTY